LAVLAIFTFVGSWNDFFWPLVVLNDPQMYTIPVGLPTLQGQWTDYGLVMASSTLAALPTIIIFLAFQRYFLQGVTVGALKG
jgi:multiple sugar transport system permease protein